MPNHDATLVTTTVQLPHALWTRARTRAAEQRENLRAVIVRALERELARPVRPQREPRAKRAAKTALVALLYAGALLGGVFVPPAFAWNEPDSFVGVTWGASVRAGEAALTKRAAPRWWLILHNLGFGKGQAAVECQPGNDVGSPVPRCQVFLELGDAILIGTWYFGEETGFYEARGQFATEHFTSLRAMFVEKYGVPTRVTTTNVVTYGGANLTNESLLWMGKKVVIRLSRFDNQITTYGGFEASTRAAYDARVERLKAAQKKGKDAL